MIEDNTINNVANYFFSDTVGYLIAAIAERPVRRCRRSRASSVGAATASITDNLVLVAAKLVGFTRDRASARCTGPTRSAASRSPALLVIVLLVFWTWVAERTTFGRHVYAVGGNAEAARRAGINVRSDPHHRSS